MREVIKGGHQGGRPSGAQSRGPQEVLSDHQGAIKAQSSSVRFIHQIVRFAEQRSRGEGCLMREAIKGGHQGGHQGHQGQSREI